MGAAAPGSALIFNAGSLWDGIGCVENIVFISWQMGMTNSNVRHLPPIVIVVYWNFTPQIELLLLHNLVVKYVRGVQRAGR